MEKLFKVSASPHVHSEETVQHIMRDVVIALIPALLVGIYVFGLRALWVTLVCVVSCVAFEALWQKFTHQKVTITDLSAVVTGILLAFNVSPSVPLYVPVVGAFVAIILAKQIFGGIGQNFINPALAARAFLLTAYTGVMTSFPPPNRFIGGSVQTMVDAVSAPTPLGLLKEGQLDAMPAFWDAFVGNVGGCIGEVSVLALLIGAAYLLWRKVITWHIPVVYLGSLFAITFLFGGYDFAQSATLMCLGGAVLGAFFMATDYTTTPMTRKGQIIFALGAGVIAGVIRIQGGYPEGVSYSILLMNLAVPLIDKFIKNRRFGGAKA